jgi:signal transduction histidine kinase
VFFAGSGALGLITLRLPDPGPLVEDLATLARVDDRALLRLESVPVNCFLYGTAAKAEPILGGRLRVEECGTEGATLRADPQRLSQALLNLMQNAAEHAAGDGPATRARSCPGRSCCP